ncbi:hypothetical protein FB192DRAFT_1385208 [Mucor lusitanicus]|uniref:Uncharacterized protein n=1 Tax=Mucor circinelloides f. lusitanicus TaxID=29924 RepID=A0A8H4BFG7_MUCCL|nr:hypothetical protein FB192DRAFT_1385208 [Mucor lusitanicus]
MRMTGRQNLSIFQSINLSPSTVSPSQSNPPLGHLLLLFMLIPILFSGNKPRKKFCSFLSLFFFLSLNQVYNSQHE